VREGDEPGVPPDPIRVLLADDDQDFLEALSALLERRPGLEVVGLAQDGLQAIELAEQLQPDAVVIDLHMPLIDGVTAVARLRHDHPEVSLIAVTGDETERLHRAVLESGADTVIGKSTLADVLPAHLLARRASP
jgi:two-component system response regulator DesR